MLKKFLKDSSGQFAIMVSVCMTALLVGTGAAIDLAAIQKEKSTLQSITDSAALAAAISRSDNVGELRQVANAAAQSNNFSNLDFKLNLTLEGETITVTAESKYDTQLMNIVGIDSLDVGALTQTTLPKEIPINIALVLDSTKSMEGGNMDALKSAATKFLEIFDEADPGIIQAGVVPYSNYVNVGLDNRDRNWMDVPIDSTTTSEERCYMTRPIVDDSKCTTETRIDTCFDDSGSYDCERSTRTCAEEAYGEEYEYCYIPTSTQTWNGCVGSRDDPDHKTPAYKGSPFPGIMNVECGSEILDLTSDLSEVATLIDSLVAEGYTYIPAGLSWGWRLLDPNLPYGGLSNNQSDRKRAMILMTDGSNRVRLAAPNHLDDPEQLEVEATNSLTSELCDGIKSDGIDLYTVSYQLRTADPVAEQMIANCATNSSYHFSADNQEELEKAFENIANSLVEIWISK